MISFELSMPGSPSWNGKWSGEGRLFAVVKSLPNSEKGKAKAEEILKPGYYSYSWPDGWRARIGVRQVTSAEARKIRKLSRGFCGYEWMIDSILLHGEIRA